MAALWALVALACGGEPVAESAVSLRFADADALARTSSLSIQFFRSDNTGDQCTRLRATRPRPRADLGPYRQALDDIARREGSSLRRDDVPVGNWVILVDATDADGNLVGVGCAQGQQVLDRQRTSIAIVIDAAS